MLWGSDKEEAEWASVKSSQEQPVTGRYVIPKSARRQKKKAADKPKKRPSAAEASAEEQPRRPKNYNDYKRSTIRQFSSLISLLIMVPVFALLVLFNWFFPRSEESMIEKRKLASFPEFTAENYFSGQFTAGINHWFTDTVPYRDNFKNAGNGFKGLFGITTDDSVNFVGDVKKVPKKTPKKDTSSAPSQSSAPVQTSQTSKPETSKTESSKPAESSSRNYREEDAEYKIENGVIVVNQDGHYRGLEMFGGGSGNAYVDALNEIRDKLDDNIRIYSMIAPLASEYYTPANCEEYTVNQKEYFDDIASRLKEGGEYKIQAQDLTEEDITAAPRNLGISIAQAPAPGPKKITNKRELWESKLLDLSRHNMLLNLPLNASIMPIMSSHIDELEDALADGQEFHIMPVADWISGIAYSKKEADGKETKPVQWLPEAIRKHGVFELTDWPVSKEFDFNEKFRREYRNHNRRRQRNIRCC